MRRSVQQRFSAWRSPRQLLAAVAVTIGCATMPTPAMGEHATASMTIQAEVSSRTSLNVSTQSLHFDVLTPSQAATAVVDFSAGARTYAGADVVLSIELLRPIGQTGDLSNGGTDLHFVAHGEGTRGGGVEAATPSVVARWTGSGHRTGRVVFSLRTANVGTYRVPVRFMLAAP